MSSSPPEKNGSVAENETTFQLQMQNVLQLMAARATGRATNEDVERAVQQMLQGNHHHNTNHHHSMTKNDINNEKDTIEPKDNEKDTMEPKEERISSMKRPRQDLVEQDEENYDEDDDDEEEKAEKVQKAPPAKKKPGRPRKLPIQSKPDLSQVDWSVYEDIPLGSQGAKMMVTFGDGKIPNPGAVKAALLGARQMLQVAIQDARYLRRKRKKVFMAAKASYDTSRPQKPTLREQVSPEMMYRALSLRDRLVYDPKCGFDVEELRELFPEEMNAYDRWSVMHAEYVAKTAKEEKKEEADGDNDKTTVETNDGDNVEADDADTSGHLTERAAQFDLRTNRMKDEWYLTFAEVRKGSFLPIGISRQEGDREWEDTRQNKRGRRSNGEWNHMSATEVRFLHWAGFDPNSSLPPPTGEVTDSLGFLAFDFFGRIVEKAIFLRNLEKQIKETGEVNEANVLLELEDGEQLTEDDINRALDDPDIKPIPLCNSEEKQGPQLYFGPGFESRLELELDEMLGSTSESPIDSEEKEIRKKENELFRKLAEPPSRDFIADSKEKKNSQGENGE